MHHDNMKGNFQVSIHTNKKYIFAAGYSIIV